LIVLPQRLVALIDLLSLAPLPSSDVQYYHSNERKKEKERRIRKIKGWKKDKKKEREKNKKASRLHNFGPRLFPSSRSFSPAFRNETVSPLGELARALSIGGFSSALPTSRSLPDIHHFRTQRKEKKRKRKDLFRQR
jgi:hypothetical protein